MADFCRQCSLEFFGADYGDMEALGDDKDLKPGMGWSVLCEDCGPIVVDRAGSCIAEWCHKHGKENERKGSKGEA